VGEHSGEPHERFFLSSFCHAGRKKAYHFIPIEKTKKGFFFNLNDSTGKACLKLAVFLLAGIFAFALIWVFSVILISYPKPMPPEAWEIFFIALFKSLFLGPLASFWILFFIAFACFHSWYQRVGIVVDEKGLVFKGFTGFRLLGLPNVIKFHAWEEFTQIRRSTVHNHEVVVFIDRYGRSFFIFQKKEDIRRPPLSFFRSILRRHTASYARFFVGDGHTLSLSEAIEAFHAPITLLEEAERKKIPALNPWPSWNVPVTGRVARLVFAVLCALFLDIALPIHTSRFSLLETWQSQASILASWRAVWDSPSPGAI
jgi:hypothetical protein